MWARLSITSLLVLYCNPLFAAEMIYVTPTGGDQQNGTREKPLKSLEGARDAIRALKAKGGKLPEGGVVVEIGDGLYELAQPIVLGPQDSGEPGRPIVYRAAAGSAPMFSGGRRIAGWKRVEGDLPGSPDAAKRNVWTAELPKSGDQRSWSFRDLWCDGKRLTRARWPNTDDFRFTVTDASVPATQNAAAIKDWESQVETKWRTFRIHPETLKSLPDARLPDGLNTGEVEFQTLLRGRWATLRVPVESAKGEYFQTAVPAGYLSHYWGGMHTTVPPEGIRGHLENALAFLDAPGEWYLDRKAGRIYYLPEEGQDPNAMSFIAPVAQHLLILQGTEQSPVSHVEVRGLTLEHTAWSLPSFGYRPALGCIYGTRSMPLFYEHQPVEKVPAKAGTLRQLDDGKTPEYALPAAVELSYATDCIIESCRVGHTGASGIGLGEGCRANKVVGCEVSDTGGHGIHLGLVHGPMCGEDFAWLHPNDEPHDNQVTDCFVHHVGAMDWGAYGIFSFYCRGTVIAHNRVADLPYSGICPAFTWFAFPSGRDEQVTVEANSVQRVMQKLFDGGAVYTKDGVAKTSVIRGNLLQDVGGEPGMNNGLFLDDGSYGFNILDNIILGVEMPIRFNNCRREHFTWGTNYFDKNYPANIAAEAGPREPYKSKLLH